MELSDSVLRHLANVIERPDFSGTRYRLGEEIGRGGAGVVYTAEDPELGRTVALKVTEHALASEAPLIARLEHPAIVPVYERGTLPDGRVWYAMKRITGQRLDRYLDAAPPLHDRLRLFRRSAEAVAFAHSQNVLHRDLKPQNIMVGAFGEVYVMDWGVEAIAGTPEYRAPEPQFTNQSDVYSLGAVLRFLAGPQPPAALNAIARKAAAPDPAARYESVAGLIADLDRYESGLAVEAWREPLWHRTRRFATQNAVLLVLLAALVAVKVALYLARSWF